MTEPKRYRKLPVEITAIELTQYGDFVRAAQWINDNGGSAVFAPKLSGGQDDHLVISTLEGNMEASVGWFIIQGVKGEFYPCDGEIFKLTYESVEAPPEAETVTGTYSVGRRSKSGTSLSGGAAKAVPV